MYQAETQGVRVTAVPKFMDGESSQAQGRYFWAYTIEIVNLSLQAIQLMSRHWFITNGRGTTQEVRGDGVIGEQPIIGPGEAYSYTSGCPLTTPDGSMHGFYAMLGQDGVIFDVEIPLFPLDSPYVKKVLH